MKKSVRLSSFFAALFFLITSVSAQDSKCDLKIPVSVVLENGSVLRNMEGSDFAAIDGKRPVHLISASTVAGPRRIVFVVETGKSLKPVTRTVESFIISEMRGNARPIDTFALISAQGPSLAVPFGGAKDTMDSAVQEIAQETKTNSGANELLAAILQAADWLQPHQEGDTIVVLSKGLEENHKTSFREVEQRLATEGIRLFGFQLGAVILGSIHEGVGFTQHGGILPTSTAVSNDESLISLAQFTGGLLAVQSIEGNELTTYKFTDDRKKAVAYMARQHLKAISEFYLLDLEGPVSNLNLTLSEDVRKSFPKASTVYPRYPRSCSTTAAGMRNIGNEQIH